MRCRCFRHYMMLAMPPADAIHAMIIVIRHAATPAFRPFFFFCLLLPPRLCHQPEVSTC